MSVNLGLLEPENKKTMFIIFLLIAVTIVYSYLIVIISDFLDKKFTVYSNKIYMTVVNSCAMILYLILIVIII